MNGLNFGIMPALLTVLFIHHKMLGTIDWGWGWILSPLWIPLAVVVLYAGATGFVAGYRNSNRSARKGRAG